MYGLIGILKSDFPAVLAYKCYTTNRNILVKEYFGGLQQNSSVLIFVSKILVFLINSLEKNP